MTQAGTRKRGRALVVLAALLSGLVTIVTPSPAHADQAVTFPDTAHVVGGVSRARIQAGWITWRDNGDAYVTFYLKDMSTDGYCARAWIMGGYDTSYWEGGWRFEMHAQTSCNGQDEYLTVLVPRSQYCFDDPHGCYWLQPSYLRIEVGRAKSSATSPPKDLTLVGYYGRPS